MPSNNLWGRQFHDHSVTQYFGRVRREPLQTFLRSFRQFLRFVCILPHECSGVSLSATCYWYYIIFTASIYFRNPSFLQRGRDAGTCQKCKKNRGDFLSQYRKKLTKAGRLTRPCQLVFFGLFRCRLNSASYAYTEQDQALQPGEILL